MGRTGFVLALVLALGLGLLVFQAIRSPSSGPPAGPPATGRPAPAGVSRTLQGQPWRLEDQRGKVVLLDFWATWCPPCLASIPDLQEIQERFGSRSDFVLAAVSLDRSPSDLRAFLREKPLPWLQLYEGERGGLAAAFNVSMLPTVYLVDRDGTIAGVNLPKDQLVRRIEALLGKAEGS